MNNMDADKYEIIPLYLSKENEFYTGSRLRDINEYRDLKALIGKSRRVILVNDRNKNYLVRYPLKALRKNIVSEIDVAFPIVHGTNVEDGTLQGYLPPKITCPLSAATCLLPAWVWINMQ